MHGQGRVHVGQRGRRRLDDQVEHRREILALVLEIPHRVALATRGVDHREIKLFFAGSQRAEEVEGVVDRGIGIAARAIDLVDHQDGPQPESERLARDEAGLRHGALEGVHQQQNRIDHLEHALHFAAEVGVAGRVHDVDTGAFPGDRGELARMVMPRSRSRSLESMAQSAMTSPARKLPAWRKNPSTKVVLPWSTWAMIAMLRTSRRRGVSSISGPELLMGGAQAYHILANRPQLTRLPVAVGWPRDGADRIRVQRTAR